MKMKKPLTVAWSLALLAFTAALWCILLFIFFFAFHLISDDNPQDGDVMLEEISSHQNVVAVNRWDRMNDWKNIFALDISLKNDVRMNIADCKRDKSGQPDYADAESL